MAEPKKADAANPDLEDNDEPIVDFDVEDQPAGGNDSSRTATKTDSNEDSIGTIGEDFDDNDSGDSGIANEVVDSFKEATVLLNRMKNNAQPGQNAPLVPDFLDFAALDGEAIAFNDAPQADAREKQPTAKADAEPEDDRKTELAVAGVAATALAASSLLLFGKRAPSSSERSESFKTALGTDATEQQKAAVREVVKNAVIAGDTTLLHEFVVAARDTGKFNGGSEQMKAIQADLAKIGVRATWTDEAGSFGAQKPKQSVLSLKLENSNNEVRIRSDVGVVGLDRDADRMDIGDTKIIKEISEQAAKNHEALLAPKPPGVGEQARVGDKWGVVAGKTSDGKYLVEIKGPHDYSTAVPAEKPEWYEKNGYEKIAVESRDVEGKVTGKRELYYYKGDPKDVLSEPRLISIDEGYEVRADDITIVDEANLKPVRSTDPSGEVKRSVSVEDIRFEGRTASMDKKGVEVTYRHYADGVAIGIPDPSATSESLLGQRDVRIYSPDGGKTKIPLYRGRGWFYFADAQTGSMGDSKFHVTSPSPAEAGTVDRVLMPLLAEALTGNATTPEAKELSKLIVMAKMKDPLNRDPAYSDQSTDRPLKEFGVDRQTGKEVYNETHVGPRGQEAKHYTVYTRSAEDARKAAEIVDKYLAKHGKDVPSLVMSPETKTGGLSDGRRLPGSNRVSLARETWPFTSISNYTFENAVDMSERMKSFGGDPSVPKQKEAVGASVEAEIGDAIRQYAKKNYGVEGPLTQEHLDRIAVDAGAKKGFLTFDSSGRLAVFGTSWETGRGSEGDIAYMGDGDSDKMIGEQKAKELIGRQGVYAIYEMVNKDGAPGSQDPLYFTEMKEKATHKDFMETNHKTLKAPAEKAMLTSLKESFLSRDMKAFQLQMNKVAEHPDRYQSTKVFEAFAEDLRKIGLDVDIKQSYATSEVQVELRNQGSSHRLVVSSKLDSAPIHRSRDNNFKTIEEKGPAADRMLDVLSESSKYGIKYNWKLPKDALPFADNSTAAGAKDAALLERINAAPTEIKAGLLQIKEQGVAGWEKLTAQIIDLHEQGRLTQRVKTYLTEAGAPRINSPEKVEMVRLFVLDAAEKGAGATSAVPPRVASPDRPVVQTGDRHNTLGFEPAQANAKPHELMVRVSYTGPDQVTVDKMVPLLEVQPDELRKRLDVLSKDKLSETIAEGERDLKRLEGDKFVEERKALEAKMESLRELQKLHEGYETARRGGKEAEYVREMQSKLKAHPSGGAGGAAMSALSKAGLASALMLLFNDLVPEFRSAPPTYERINPGSSGS